MSLHTLNRIRAAVAARPAEIIAARALGRKVVGWLGYNIPEEIIHALGLIPVRIGAGSEDRLVDVGSRYISSKNCVLTRQLVGLFAENKDPYVQNTDLVAIDATCIQMFRVGEVVQYFFKKKFIGLGVPHNSFHAEAGDYFYNEVQEFAEALEAFAGARLETPQLEASIRLFAEIRKRLVTLYDHQVSQRPRIAWRHIYEVVQAGYFLDREQYLHLLGELLAELDLTGGVETPEDTRARIFVAGSSIPPGDSKLVDLIESLGGRIVSDDLWSGGLVPSIGVVINEPTLRAIADGYLNRVPHGALPYLDLKTDRRLENLRRQIKHFRAQGVIYHTLRFCDAYSFKANETKDELRKAGTPLLEIHTEYAGSDFEAIRTRIEAFIEMLNTHNLRPGQRTVSSGQEGKRIERDEDKIPILAP